MRHGIRFLSFVSAFLLWPSLAYSQRSSSPPASTDIRAHLVVRGKLPSFIKEASGLEISASGILWTHNDDRLPVLYGLDTTGRIVKTIHLNHRNNGWEDLAMDNERNLYIGAFGNNKNDRKDLAILKIKQPETNQETVVNAEVIRYEYSDQQHFPPDRSRMNFDADAFVSISDSLYIITKNRTSPFTGYAKIYRLPSIPGQHKAMLYDSIFLGTGEMMGHWVTGADISPDGRLLALLSHDRVWIVTDFKGTRFSTGRIYKIQFDNYSHKTGICFADSEHLYIVDELEYGILGGKLYSLDLNETPDTLR